MIKIDRPDCPEPNALRKGNYKASRNKDALRQAAHDKCMYCESKISQVDFGQIEHIKPKSKFPELEFNWGNLGYACPKCNNNKSDNFHQDTPYIDPYTDDPKEHLYAFGSMIYPRNGCERGELTIFDVQLNRTELIERRDERIQEILKAINACYKTSNEALRKAALRELKQETAPNKEYSMLVEALLSAHIKQA